MADHDINSPHSNPTDDCLLEQDLTAYWHFEREDSFRLDRRIIWSSVDSYLTVLGHDPPVRFPFHSPFLDMWNKPTCVYFEPSSYLTPYSSYPPRIFFAAVYEAWRHDCGEYWSPEYGHFMANPVLVTERGPKTLGDIADIHQEMCAFAKEYEPEDEHYRMHRSYPQVLLVCDKIDWAAAAKEDDGFVSLKEFAEQQTVLFVRTRAPGDISFDDLASHALPLERSDMGNLDVLRVPLSIAVKYMVALETHMGESQGKNPNRFDAELLSLDIPLGFDSSVRRHPAMWGAAMAEVARKHGNGSMEQLAWPALRIAAGVSGQPYELEQDPWRERWKPGYA